MESSSVTVTDMEHSTTFSLTELAALTGSGKARLRAMIEVGTLAATRAESGRREWIVRREDAVAANLRVPADVKLRSRMVIHRSSGSDGVDAAMQQLFAELLGPIELSLARIESENERLSKMVVGLTQNQSSRSRRRKQFKTIVGRLQEIAGRLLG